jgi:MFS family permease
LHGKSFALKVRKLMAEHPSSTRWPLVATLILCGVVAATHIGKAPPSLPLLRAELGFGLAASGWVLSMINVIGMAIGLFAGLLADRIGPRRAVLGGLLMLASADFAGAFAPSVTAILIGRFVEGIGFFAVVVATPAAMLPLTAPAHQRLALGVWGAYMPAGTAAMMLVAPLVLPHWGWRGLWAIDGLLSLVCLALLLVQHVPEPPHGRARLNWRNLRAVLSPAPLLLAGCFATYTISFIAIAGFLPTYMVEQRGFTPAHAAVLTAAFAAANILGNVASGPLQAMGARRWALVASAALLMAGCVALIFAESLPDLLRYGACIAMSAVGGMAPGAMFASVPRNAPGPALIGATNGLMLQGANFGNTIGPPLLALIVSASGQWSSGAYLLWASLALCTMAALGLRAVERRSPR